MFSFVTVLCILALAAFPVEGQGGSRGPDAESAKLALDGQNHESFKQFGLGDYEIPASTAANKGYIIKNRLTNIDLTKIEDIDRLCVTNPNPGKFQPCTGEFSNVKVLMASDRSDMKPRVAKGAIDFNTLEEFPESAPPFAPHLVAIKDAYVNSWGTIFDYKHWYDHGGCTDRAIYQRPAFIYEMNKLKNFVNYDHPALSLVHPFSSMYFHEFIELHAMLLMAKPVMDAFPNITIFLNKHLHHSQLFPLLKVLDIDMSKTAQFQRGYNFQTIGFYQGTHYVAHAPYIITPLSHWCEYISPGITKQMRAGYEKLPYWNEGDVGTAIVVHDRANVKPKRFLREGQMIFDALQEKYGGALPIRMFRGNESLEEIVKIFRGAKVLIAAHGAGLANMMFMPEGGMVVEFRPSSWPNRCFIDLANNIGITHYLYDVKTNLRGYEMRIDANAFLDKLWPMLLPFVGAPQT